MSKDYSHLVARVAQECPDFEAFFADMCARLPALRGRGAIEIPPAGFKRALKTAYLAGHYDAIAVLLGNDDDVQADAPEEKEEIRMQKAEATESHE